MIERASGPTWLLPRVKRIAVAHAQGETVRVVIAESAGDAAKIIAAESFPRTAPADIRAALARHHTRHLIRLVPAARTIARAVSVPRAPTPEVLTALELMAEAQLVSTPAEHRRGWGIAPIPGAAGNVPAVLVGWAAPAPEPILDGPHAEEHESWTSELVGLTLMLRADAASSAAIIDRSAGSIGMAASEQGLKFRTIREDPDSSARLDAITQEISAAVGAGAAVGADGGVTVLLSSGAGDRFQSRAPEARNPQWLARYGVAAAVALAVASEDQFPQVRPLVSMRANPPARVLTPIERAVAWVASPRRAAALLGIAVLAMLLVPWGLAWARYTVLSRRVEATRQGDSDTQNLEARGDFMQELSKRRWPVTKLLADIAGCMPVGVQVEQISVAPGEQIQVRGTADTSDTFQKFTTNLSNSGVFQPDIKSTERGADGLNFELSVRVTRPTAEAKRVEDFAAQSLGVRLYGEGYKEVEAVEQAKQREAEAARASNRGGSSAAGFDGGASRQAEEEPIPDALSTDAIAKLDRTEAMKEMSNRRKVASRAGLDPEVKKRLTAEVEALRGRLAELKGQGQ